MLILEVFAVFGKRRKTGAIPCIWENPPVMGNAATWLGCGNICLTVNIVLSKTVPNFNFVIRTQ